MAHKAKWAQKPLFLYLLWLLFCFIWCPVQVSAAEQPGAVSSPESGQQPADQAVDATVDADAEAPPETVPEPQNAKADAAPAGPPPKRSRKPQLMDVETAMAILAQPFDEEAEADRPIPDAFVINEDGSKAPLPGVLSVFLTGSTLEILGCGHVGADKQPPVLVCTVSKETILGDVQFRGAISDFHAYKQAVVDSDCDPLVMRLNETDLYGDGNNFEVAVKQEAVDTWGAMETELTRRRARDATIARRKLAQKSLPTSKLQIKVRLHSPADSFHLARVQWLIAACLQIKAWVSQGSEPDVEALTVQPTRDPIVMTLERPRRVFQRDIAFTDKDAQEVHAMSSAHMELRPFKDTNYSLHRQQLHCATQAAPSVAEASAQVSAVLCAAFSLKSARGATNSRVHLR